MPIVRPVVRSAVRPAVRGVFGWDALTPLQQLLALGDSDLSVYDPADLTSVYQETDGDGGTTGADGQPAGIVLDRNFAGGNTSGLTAAAWIAAATEEVTNGTFDTDSDWSEIAGGSTVSISGGQCTITTTTNHRGAYQAKSIPDGSALVISITVSDVGGGNLVLLGKTANDGFNGGTTFTSTTITTPGTYTIVIGATSAVTGSIAIRTPTTVTNAVVDDVSIKILPGNHLIAPSDAKRPTLRQSGSLFYLDFDGGSDHELSIGSYSGGSGKDFIFGMRSSDTIGCFIGAGTSEYIVWQDGDANAAELGVGSPSYAVDRVALSSPDRDALHDAVATGADVVASITDADTSAWSELEVFFFTATSTFNTTGRLYALAAGDSLSAANLALAESFAASRAGVTL